ncbi:MAG: hypothetical protein F6K32_00695 [Desertifilum sp. SIO1I2]|nr:hypothetical protein [Desertifilum sp. SIO1I2]
MITLPGITIHSKIYESLASLVYRGIREALRVRYLVFLSFGATVLAVVEWLKFRFGGTGTTATGVERTVGEGNGEGEVFSASNEVY